MTRLRVAGIAILMLSAVIAHADIFRPAYLELRELGEDRYAVLWKVPSGGAGTRLSVYLQFPSGIEEVSEPRAMEVDGAWIERRQIFYPGGLDGERIRIEGNAVGVTDVIARLERLDGSSQVERLAIESPQFVIKTPAESQEIAWTYTVLGVEHILGGIDHLLFVLALLLVVHGAGRIFWTVTAFTAAHSITLAAATLGWIHVPGPPVEAIIAMSIVFVAGEVVHGLRGKPGMTARAPWIVSFSFGLLHGFGFAGALEEVGLPQNAIPLALLTFNLGVELGQLMFVVAILPLRIVLEHLSPRGTRMLYWSAAYAVGTVAAFWTFDRIAGFLS